MAFTIVYYRKPNGKSPARDFIMAQPEKMRTKLFRAIRQLELNGDKLRAPYSKFLGDGIFEVRTQHARGITRVLYFFYVGNKAVLTNGFVKKSDPTPPGQIERAKRYRDDFLRQMGRH